MMLPWLGLDVTVTSTMTLLVAGMIYPSQLESHHGNVHRM